MATPLLEQIADTAARTRAAQREYFKTRTNSTLINTKNLERVLDGLLDRWNIEQTKRIKEIYVQESLFHKIK